MKKVLIVVIFLFSLSLVNADNITIGLDWLENNIIWDTASIEDISFTLLALDKYNRNTDVGLIKLNQKKDSSSCFPIGGCNSKDTALAALALYNLGENITSQLTWLNSTLTAAPLPSGEWIIQIITSNTGNCTFVYDNTNSTFQINGVENSWIYINGQNPSNPSINVNFNEPVEYINVDCNLAGNTIVSLLRKVGNTFYIVNQYSGNDVTVEINNACYSSSIGGGCNVDSSFYVSWVLNRINIDVKTIPYLENNINNNNLYYAILADIDDSQINLDNLIENQNIYWDNVYTTSFGVDALENTNYNDNRTTALNWLMSQQISSGSNFGSWNSDVTDTAVILYLALSEGGIFTPPGIGGGYCGNGIINYDLEEECDDGSSVANAATSPCIGSCDTITCKCPSETGAECTSNFDCNPNEYCDSVNKTCQQKVSCSSNIDCEINQYCDTIEGICKSSVECSSNADCDINEECDIINKVCKPKSDRCGNGFCESQYGEDDFTCPQDCEEEVESRCGDGICSGDEDEGSCPDDCKERKSLWWIWLIIIIVILTVLGIFGFKYFSKPKAPKGPSFLGPQRPIPPSYPQRPMPGQPVSRKDEAVERELDKSLREARELLKKK